MRNIPIQLIVILILAGFSGLSAIYRWLRAKQIAKEARDRAEQRQLETLRTGRDPATESHDTAESQRQRELAARREVQLAELRRRAQERARQQANEPASRPTPPIAPPIPQHIPGSSGPTVPTRPPSPVRAAPRQTARVQSQSQPLPAVRAKQRQSAPAPITAHVDHLHDEVVIPRTPAPVIHASAPRTPEEWRRAILASEIMAKPLALREAPPALPF